MPAKSIRLLWTLLFSLGLAGVLASSAAATGNDVIVLINDDRVTGEIKILQQGQLQYKTNKLGTVYAKWYEVRAITSQKVFRADKEDGTHIFGSLAAPRDSATLLLVTESDSITVPMQEVVGLVPIERNFFSRMHGSLNFGFSYTKSSNIGQLTLDFSTTYQAKVRQAKFSWNANFTTQTDTTASRYQNILLSLTNELKKKRWYGGVALGFQQNTELGIDARILVTTGLGRRFIETNRNTLSALIGPSLNREWSVDTTAATTNVDAILDISYAYYQFRTPKSSITSSLTVFPGLTDWGRVRASFQTSLSHEIVSHLTVALSFYDNYDSDPPSASGETNDWAINTTVGWTY